MLRSKTSLRWAIGILWGLTFLVVLSSLRFVFVAIELASPAVAYHVFERPNVFYAHVAGASLALALVPFQFWTRLRVARRALHRWLGRLYGFSILVSGLAGVWLAVTTEAGVVAALGFGILGVIWIAVTAQAIRLAMVGDIARHRQWMIRSAALTLAAVSLRLYLPILAASFGFAVGYSIVAWLCWVSNALIAEWLLRRDGQRRPLAA